MEGLGPRYANQRSIGIQSLTAPALNNYAVLGGLVGQGYQFDMVNPGMLGGQPKHLPTHQLFLVLDVFRGAELTTDVSGNSV